MTARIYNATNVIVTIDGHVYGKQESMISNEPVAPMAPPMKRPRAPRAPNPIRDKIHEIETDLSARIVERQRAIHGMLVAALAGEHTLLIGPPGTAKSQLARGFMGALEGATYFEWLLTKYTTPEEIFGPVSFAGLKIDEYRRVTTGKLPEAHVVYLDEIFKSNSALLNSLLGVVNERIFHDNGKAKRIPLITCVGASNELPETQDLAAIYDRFVMRFHVDPIADQASFLAMLRNEPRPPVAPLTLEEWATARSQIETITIPNQVVNLIFSLRSNLLTAGVKVSDRRWVKATKILRAQAWMCGASSVGTTHLSVLTDMLWDRPDQLTPIQTVIGGMSSSEVASAKRIVESMQALTVQNKGYTGQQWSQSAANLRVELKKAITRIESMRDSSTDESVAEELDAMIEGLREQGKEITMRLREDLGVGF